MSFKPSRATERPCFKMKERKEERQTDRETESEILLKLKREKNPLIDYLCSVKGQISKIPLSFKTVLAFYTNVFLTWYLVSESSCLSSTAWNRPWVHLQVSV